MRRQAAAAPSTRPLFRRAAAKRNSVSLISVDLPEPETPVTQVNRPTGMLDGEILQIVAVRAANRDPVRTPGIARRCGTGMASRPAR